jgi:hypothetical protein
MIWRPHTEHPTRLPIVAMIALRDNDGEFFCLGLHMRTEHRPAVWVSEDSDEPLIEPEYWWLPEEEILAPLTVMAQVSA